MTSTDDFVDLEYEFSHILTQKDLLYKKILKHARYSTEEILTGLDNLYDLFNQFINPLLQLSVVDINQERREILKHYKNCITSNISPIITNKHLYKKICTSLKKERNQKISTENYFLAQYFKNDFLNNGVLLSASKKNTLRLLNTKINTLSIKFESNISTSTNCWIYTTNSEKKLSGLSSELLKDAIDLGQRTRKGKYVLNASPRFCNIILEHAEDTDTRKAFYIASSKTASEKFEDYNNKPIIEQLLTLRHYKAKILGHTNYAEFAFQKFLLPNPKIALSILDYLININKSKLFNEREELISYVKKIFNRNTNEINAWDIKYYSQKLFNYRFGDLQTETRKYFSVNSTLSGIFSITKKLFGLTFIENKQVPKWNDTVYYFDIYNKEGNLFAGIYLDLFARPHKQMGAWTDSCYDFKHHKNKKPSKAVAFVNCNFNFSVSNTLFSHNELKTLFHEFGHALHHILNQSKYAVLSGIRAYPWDFIEFPSYFFENFCWDIECLNLCAINNQTSSTIPEPVLIKLLEARDFQSALHDLEEITYAYFDILIHLKEPPLDLHSIAIETLNRTGIIDLQQNTQFYNTFSHIFSGYYACSYYSYPLAKFLANNVYSIIKSHAAFNASLCEDLVNELYQTSVKLDSFISFIAKHKNGNDHFLTNLTKISSPDILESIVE